MKEKIRDLNKSLAICRFISLAYLPMITIQWLNVFWHTNPFSIGCALYITDIGIEQIIEQYKAEKEHVAFINSLPKEWLP